MFFLRTCPQCYMSPSSSKEQISPIPHVSLSKGLIVPLTCKHHNYFKNVDLFMTDTNRNNEKKKSVKRPEKKGSAKGSNQDARENSY